MQDEFKQNCVTIIFLFLQCLSYEIIIIIFFISYNSIIFPLKPINNHDDDDDNNNNNHIIIQLPFSLNLKIIFFFLYNELFKLKGRCIYIYMYR